MRKLLAPTWILLCAVVALGCTGNKRQDTLRASIITLDATRDGFFEWDLQHQTAIVEKAATKDEAHKAIDDYRRQKEVVLKLIVLAYRAVGFASTHDDEASLQAAEAAAKKLFDGIVDIKKGAP